MSPHVRSLYRFSCAAVAGSFSLYRDEVLTLPAFIAYDIYEELLFLNNVLELSHQLKNTKHFNQLLERKTKWNVLFQLVHYVEQSENGFLGHIAMHQAFQGINNMVLPSPVPREVNGSARDSFIHALELSTFLMDAGHFQYAEMALASIKDLAHTCHQDLLEMQFELYNRLLHVRTLDCKFQQARDAFCVASEILNALRKSFEDREINVTLYYTAAGLYLFALSDYDEAYKFAIEAVKAINWKCSARDAIDALRQASKACIVKRKFKPAELLVKKAVQLSRTCFGEKSPKFAESLSDFAFYLLNVDSVAASVQIYQDTLKVRQETLGTRNLMTAISHEDLAYALYVRDYSIGSFGESRQHAELAIDTLSEILPGDHLLLASSKRVKALILEELAIDFREKETCDKLLSTAEELHLESLHLARINFGENNVQTAKHYGNLGRLYQSMKRYDEAEQMHLKAIGIKEHLLGREDYEVALSLGHLASLYNYDMGRYADAEELYVRSIRIGIKLFGDSYSGLEYDYRGLIYLYAQTSDHVEMARYHLVLSDWERARRSLETLKPMEDVGTWDNLPVADLINKINFCSLNSE